MSKRNYKNRILSLIVTLAMCVTIFPLQVMAEGETASEADVVEYVEETIGEILGVHTVMDGEEPAKTIQIRPTENTGGILYVGGVAMPEGSYLASGADTVSMSAPASGGYAYFADNKLTLKDYEYKGSGYVYDEHHSETEETGEIDPVFYYALIHAQFPSKLEIVLEGSSSIDYSYPNDTDNCCFTGIYAGYGNLVFSGDGSLNISANFNGITVEKDGISICGGNLNINADAHGISAENGSVDISGGDIKINAGYSGIICADNVNITDGAVDIYAYNNGIYIYDGDFVVTGGFADIKAVCDGVFCNQSVTFDGGFFHAVSLNAEEYGGYYAVRMKDEYDEDITGSLSLGLDLEILLPEGETEETVKNGVAEVIIASPEHTWKDEYILNTTHHWKVCGETDCHLIANNAIHRVFDGSDYDAHDTNGADGVCSVCGYDINKTSQVYVGGVGLAEGEYLSNDIKFSMTEPDGGYAHFSDGVLTLNNYEYTGSGYEYIDEYGDVYSSAIYSEKDLTILLKGNSIISNSDDDREGISVDKANLIIKGDGILNLNADYGVLLRSVVLDYEYVSDGNLSIESGTLNITSGDFYSVCASGNISIGGGNVNISSKGSGISSEYCDVTVSGGTIDIVSNDGDGVHAAGDISISDGTIDINAEYAGIISWCGDVTVSGGTIDIDTDCSKGISTYEGGDITISDGNINISVLEDEAIEIEGGGIFTVSGGKITVSSGSDGIGCDGVVNITGGEIKITADSNGIEADEIKITGGSVEAESRTGESAIGRDPYEYKNHYITIGRGMSIVSPTNGTVQQCSGTDPEDAGVTYVYDIIVDDSGNEASYVKIVYAPSDSDGSSSSTTITNKATVTSDSLQYENGTITGNLEVNIENYETDNLPAMVVLAVYDDENRLVFAEVKNEVTLAKSENNEINFSGINISDASADSYRYKVFVWDSMSSMTPLTTANGEDI